MSSVSVLRQREIFEASSLLVIDQSRAVAAAGSEGIVGKLNKLRAKYAALLRTAVIVEPVGEKLGLPPGQVVASLRASLPGNSLIIIVVARTPRSSRAKQIADAAAEELVLYLKREMEVNKVPVEEHITLTVVQSAPPGRKVEPTRSEAIQSGATNGGIALVLTYGLFQAIFSRRSRRP